MGKIFIALVIVIIVGFYLYNGKKNKGLAEKNIALGQVFLQQNLTETNMMSTPSGIQYLILEKGQGTIHPKATDKVKVHYHGTLLDGTIFDSSVERKQSISFGLNQVIKGWTEGVQLMVVGDKTRFFIPSHLAYGNSAAGKIQPGSLLIFDIELLAINE
jgi:peptidylprolyl isomerase